MIILLIALAALGLRGVYLWQQASNNPLTEHPILDGMVHHEWAQQIAEGKAPRGAENKPYFRAPLYYHLLGWLYAVTGPEPMSGRIAGIVLGAACVYLLGRLGAAVGGPAAGVLAALFAALYWPFIVFDAELLTVGLEVFLDVAMLVTMLAAARRGSLRLFFLAGLLWGFSAITRPNVLAFVPAFLLWAWLVAQWPGNVLPAGQPFGAGTANPGAVPAAKAPVRGARFGRWLAIVACTGTAGALVVLPVTARNWVVGSEFVLIASQGGVNFYIGNNPQSDGYTAIVPGTRPDWWGGYEDTHKIPEKELGRPLTEREVSSYWASKAWEWIRSDPGAWGALVVKKFRTFWSPVEIPNNQPMGFFASLSPISSVFWVGFPAAAVLGIAGVAFWRRDPSGGRPWLLLGLFAATYMLTVVAFFTPERYRLPVIPVLIVSAAYGLASLLGKAPGRTGPRAVAYAVLALAAGVFLYTNPPDRDQFRRSVETQGSVVLANYFGSEPPEGPADYARAIELFERALALNPADFKERQKLIRIYQKAGKPEGAIPHLEKIVAQNPGDIQALRALVGICEKAGRPGDAARYQELLVKAAPAAAEPRVRLIPLLIAAGRLDDVAAQQTALMEMAPNVKARDKVVGDVAAMFARAGRFDEAAARYAELVRLSPTDPEPPVRLFSALRRVGRGAEAIPVLRAAAGQFPRNIRLINTLAWALATSPTDDARDGAAALQLTRRLETLLPQPTAESLDTLAAAQAENGQFIEAAQTAAKAVTLAKEADKPDLAARIQARQALYASGRAYRDSGEPESEDPRR